MPSVKTKKKQVMGAEARVKKAKELHEFYRKELQVLSGRNTQLQSAGEQKIDEPKIMEAQSTVLDTTSSRREMMSAKFEDELSNMSEMKPTGIANDDKQSMDFHEYDKQSLQSHEDDMVIDDMEIGVSVL
jgi:hypothetical protein